MFGIVFQIFKGKSGFLKGNCGIEGYKNWCLLTNYGFGVSWKQEADSEGTDGVGQEQTAAAVDSSQEQTMSIGKFLDSCSPNLMHLALAGKSDTKSEYDALIHCLEAYTDAKGKRFTHAYLKIRLGDVLVKDWSISGAQGSDVEAESFTISYRKAAIKLETTADGKIYQPYTAKGWDSIDRKDWDVSMDD